MTIDEAIAEIEQSGLYGNQVHQETLVLARDALRTQQQRENPQPLTLDELREMGGEPVYVVTLDNPLENQPYWAIAARLIYMATHGLPTATNQRRANDVYECKNH